jgi:two-component sensor histidine kinase
MAQAAETRTPIDVFITEELSRRAPKATDYLREKLALQDLAGQMIDHPADVLPRLVDLAIELCGGVTGGISLYEDNPPPGVFRWNYLRGDLARFNGATTPRNFSPCGVTLDFRKPILVRRPERTYTWLVEANISLPECLLVPLYIGGVEPLGTLWIVSETEGHFDSGHSRAMAELASFVGVALNMLRTGQRLKEALEQQELLTREMSHRVKNLFAITNGLIRLSAREATTPEEMARTLTGRLNALASAHGLVRRSFDENSTAGVAELSVLASAVLRPHQVAGSAHRQKCIIEGPEVSMGDNAATGLALVLHELATNAAKYGALSNDAGEVNVSWLWDDPLIVLQWRERGGPSIEEEPTKAGFGRYLCENTIQRQMNGTMSYNWRPEGLLVEIKIPAEALSQ